MTRRAFNRMLLLATVGASLPLSGCNVVQGLIDYIPWIIRAIDAVTSILGIYMPPPADVVLGIIKGALADIQAAAVEYLASPAADKTTLMGKIQTFLHDIVDNFQQFLDALANEGPILSVVLGIIQVVLSILGYFAGKLKTVTNVPTMRMPASLRAGREMIYVTPEKLSVNQFKDRFNRIVYDNGHPEVEMY